MPRVLQKHRLCASCLERQGGDSEEFELSPPEDCFICRGLFSEVGEIAKAIAKAARRYEFRTFAIGLGMPEGVQEREDELRSSLKMKGGETVKVQLSRMIAQSASRALRKGVDKGRPDLMVVADLQKAALALSSRPLFYYARYTKPSGVSQRNELCRECHGRGCKKCRLTGFQAGQSVEALLRKRLAETGGEKMTFTWIGSEDRKSEVFPPGRPFVVEVKNPLRRKLPRRFELRSRRGPIEVSRGRVLAGKPKKLPSFKFRTKITAEAASKVDKNSLRELRSRFNGTTVEFRRINDTPAFKKVYRAVGRARGRVLEIDAELDGGLPVKRFVSGELVSPSVSEVLKTEVRCRRFDIYRVTETGNLELA